MSDRIEIEGRVLSKPDDPEKINTEPDYISVGLDPAVDWDKDRVYLTIPKCFCYIEPVPEPGQTVLVSLKPPQQLKTAELELQARIIPRH